MIILDLENIFLPPLLEINFAAKNGANASHKNAIEKGNENEKKTKKDPRLQLRCKQRSFTLLIFITI